MNTIRWRVRIFAAVQNTSQNCKTDKWLFRCRVCSIPRKSENQLICTEDRFFYTIHIRKPIEIFASMRYNVCTHIFFLLRTEEALMSIFGFFKKKADIKPQVEKETAIETPVQRGVAISKRVELDSHNENSIRNCYIAFDVETTGLSPISDRIVEIGATIFQNGTVQRVFSDQASAWSARRTKAISLLFAQQEKERKAAEKLKRQAEKVVQKEIAVSVPKNPRGRAILQMDDSGNIIKEFDSIAAAVQEVGVSSKSIRDAANGVQKRAGGYHWMYKE